MQKKQLFLTVLLALVLCASSGLAQGSVEISPSHPHIAYIGRVSFANPESPCFTYPGVEIRTVFEGTSLRMKVKPNSGYFMVEIDKREPFKVGAAENDSVLLLAQNLPEGRHTVKIILAYEGYQRRPEFRGFILDKGKTLPQAPVLPSRKMEFIGNSITCGYGAEVTDPTAPFKDETENHYYTYAAATARAFDAQNLIVARSGIGIYRNYGGSKTGSPDCMPAMYGQTLFKDPSEQWDFSRYTPDVVCINLGTNDTSTQPYDTQLLENGYRNFLKTVRNHYPDAKIVLLTGSMLSGKPLQDVKKALDQVVAEAKERGDRQVYRFDLSPQDGSLGYGASYHPSKQQQAKGAKELIPFIAEITGWTYE
ncbi:SGNH/GDSL hydrolase family protein [Parabacteroides sp. PF5-9]|uniref:SGNH/GDSL hydrolase family protein n=1 Tax=Parabacteroides sp. PF5-9 TaxID=1742404 RepID=UPI0024746190|nr:SGNH/GDSL hydrolase family protein [Parabacteroides sp. PF5-9]MDH6356343.1 lysophospholipase L1-like esterase [Parabacteroides sp. PF5-9]